MRNCMCDDTMMVVVCLPVPYTHTHTHIVVRFTNTYIRVHTHTHPYPIHTHTHPCTTHIPTHNPQHTYTPIPPQVVDLLTQSRVGDIAVLDVSGKCNWADTMVVATCRSRRHVHATGAAVMHQVGCVMYFMSHVVWWSFTGTFMNGCYFSMYFHVVFVVFLCIFMFFWWFFNVFSCFFGGFLMYFYVVTWILLSHVYESYNMHTHTHTQVKQRVREVAPGVKSVLDGAADSEWAVVDAGTVCVLCCMEYV